MPESIDVSAPIDKPKSVYKFEFNGTVRELIPIALINFLLNVITLSLFRFWGRTRVRRYLWSRTSIMGDPFEYTGNGKELFIGFVVVLLLIFAPFYGLMFWGQTLMLQDPTQATILMGTAYLALLFLFGLGWYRAQKFRLSRTRWRGIRGGLEDNGVRYGFKFLGMMLLTFVTLGLAAPYAANKLWSAESNTRRFGTAKFSYDGKAREFYMRYLIIIFLAMMPIILIAALKTVGEQLETIFGEVSSTIEAGEAVYLAGSALSSGASQMGFIVGFILVYLFMIFLATVVYTFYEYGKIRTFWNHTRLEGSEFVFTGTFGGMLKMIVGNFFLEAITIGILHPVAQLRWLRYFSTNLEIHGDLDLEAIAQREGEAMSYGEGLAEGFDFGGV